MNSTKIEWADLTINPVVGCSKCSPGCDNCYAERFAARLAKNPATAKKYARVVDERGKWTGTLGFALDGCLASLYSSRKAKRVFIGSMGDLFHENMSQSELLILINGMSLMPQHTFLLLTKRPERARDMLAGILGVEGFGHVWLGVTVCNQTEADAKIPVLLDTPAAKRFVSVEPMLGPVDLGRKEFLGPWLDAPYGSTCLDWVICGGETGPGARPMHPGWVRSLRDQCQAAGIPFFFKGWGEWCEIAEDQIEFDDNPRQGFMAFDLPQGQLPGPCNMSGCWGPEELKAHGCAYVARIGKRLSGRLLDGCEWNEVPA